MPVVKSCNCSILVNVVVEGVVAPKRDQRPEAESVREENLSGSIKPHLRIMSETRKSVKLYSCQYACLSQSRIICVAFFLYI